MAYHPPQFNSNKLKKKSGMRKTSFPFYIREYTKQLESQDPPMQTNKEQTRDTTNEYREQFWNCSYIEYRNILMSTKFERERKIVALLCFYVKNM